MKGVDEPQPMEVETAKPKPAKVEELPSTTIDETSHGIFKYSVLSIWNVH